jgi:hypothetical protein
MGWSPWRCKNYARHQFVVADVPARALVVARTEGLVAGRRSDRRSGFRLKLLRRAVRGVFSRRERPHDTPASRSVLRRPRRAQRTQFIVDRTRDGRRVQNWDAGGRSGVEPQASACFRKLLRCGASECRQGKAASRQKRPGSRSTDAKNDLHIVRFSVIISFLRGFQAAQATGARSTRSRTSGGTDDGAEVGFEAGYGSEPAR